MSDLLAAQAGFAAALRDVDATPAAARWLCGDDALLERRLAIYRANMVASADKALSAACPVVRQVVGEEFFHALARAFQRAHPSTSGDLGEFGAAFADFLAGFEHTRSLPYLPDLARLEWAVHRAHGAADAPGWDAAALSAIAPDQQAQIRFAWSAGLAVVESNFPVVRVWTIHQPDHGGEFTVDWDVAERALVARDGFAVRVDAIDAGAATFLQSSLAGATLGDAATAALLADPHFDLGGLLGRAIASQHICGFTV